MARPNLSVKTMSLVDSRWSFAVSHWLAGVRVCRAINDHRPRTVQEKDRRAGKSRRLFPFQWLLAKPGGTGVSTCTLRVGFLCELCAILGAKDETETTPRRHSQGMPEG